ncbi:MAG: hypothetical protein ACYST0_02830 [Planctomycetota bacterium]|jgi:hypothetical protein
MKNQPTLRIVAAGLAVAAMFLTACETFPQPSNPNRRSFAFLSEPAGAAVQFSLDGVKYKSVRNAITPSRLTFNWPVQSSAVPVKFRVKWPDGTYGKVMTVRKGDGSLRLRWWRTPAIAKNTTAQNAATGKRIGTAYEPAFTVDR